MRLTVPTPPGWLRQQVAGGELLKAPSRELELLVLPLEGAKLEPPKWLWTALLHAGEQPGLEPEIEPINVVSGELTTVGAWRALTVEGKVGAESRLVAYFTFLDLSATVIARCGSEISEWRDEVIGILARAVPDFSQHRSTCLAELLGAKPPVKRAPPATLPPHTWRRASSGGDVVLIPRLDPDSGWIRVTSGLTPLQWIPQLFSELDPGWPVRPELGITEEGEYFAIASSQRGRTQRTLAIVLGAESYTRIEANTMVPERFDMFATAVRALAYQTALGYGAGRVRPYYYAPPAEWGALVRPGSTLWISPICARQYHVLRVFEACPPDQDATLRRRRFETVAAEFLTEPPRGPAVYYRPDEREVRVFAYTCALPGGELRILEATLIDEAYCYPFRIECDPRLFDVSMQLLEEVVATIVPLPPPLTEAMAPQAPELFSLWAD